MKYILAAAQFTGICCWISSAAIFGFTIYKTIKEKRKLRKQIKRNYEWIESKLINEGSF